MGGPSGLFSGASKTLRPKQRLEAGSSDTVYHNTYVLQWPRKTRARVIAAGDRSGYSPVLGSPRSTAGACAGQVHMLPPSRFPAHDPGTLVGVPCSAWVAPDVLRREERQCGIPVNSAIPRQVTRGAASVDRRIVAAGSGIPPSPVPGGTCRSWTWCDAGTLAAEDLRSRHGPLRK